MFLTLNKNFSPFQLPEEQSIQFEHFTFSGGEPHIRIMPDVQGQHIHIATRINSFNDMGILLTAVDALKRAGISSFDLFIPYFPAARQDRIMQNGEALTVKVYADLINALGAQTVTIFDPHSDVAPALLNNCKVLNNHAFVQQVIDSIPERVSLVSPDGGALKKIYKLSADLGGIEIIQAAKMRDVKTGKLSNFQVYADDLHGKACLIVDDICDGGRTFIGLAQKLREKGASKVYLAISHGIFSYGFKLLEAHLDGIFTTNSFGDFEHPLLRTFDLRMKTEAFGFISPQTARVDLQSSCT